MFCAICTGVAWASCSGWAAMEVVALSAGWAALAAAVSASTAALVIQIFFPVIITRSPL